jgi:hypothetical protein
LTGAHKDLNMAGRFRTDCEGFHRRNFLKVGAAGLLGLTLPDLLRLEAHSAPEAQARRKAKSIIMVWLAGGPATIDMWDLKPEAPETIRGEFKPIDTKADGIQISEHLPKMAEVMDKCAIVRSLYHNIGAHELGTVYMTTGNRPSLALQYPSLGSITAKVLQTPPGVPAYVTFNQLRGGKVGGGGYLGTAFNPFQVEGSADRGQLRVKGISLPVGFSPEQLENRNKLLETLDEGFKDIDQSADIASGLDKFHREALDILRSDKTKKAFDLGDEKSAVRDRYGKDGFGQSALAARRLIEAGVRFVTIGTGGWDTHGQNFQRLKTNLLPPVDRTLSALISDLDERGLLDSTIVYCAGEFNRTPKINKNAGRDHWGRSLAVLLAGGGLARGYAHGTTDAQGMVPAALPCTPDDVCATMFHCLGLEPSHELQTSTGRPIQLFREGKIIDKLLA